MAAAAKGFLIFQIGTFLVLALHFLLAYVIVTKAEMPVHTAHSDY